VRHHDAYVSLDSQPRGLLRRGECETWRLERMAIDQLNSLSDRQLKDLGLHPSEITGAVKNRETRGRRLGSYHVRFASEGSLI
jgi:uncharacterized protein YjiS (DUF1127 family)